ncbi:hypothetical protein SH2C18_23970 [Clostridium sediminicola]|uniref:ABC transporter substrate-binding protein n=1 Tax=Clostridium sediminicola TaxID=3114879 RepID=UPI0031F233B5
MIIKFNIKSLFIILTIVVSLAGCGKKDKEQSTQDYLNGEVKMETIHWWGNYGGSKKFLIEIVNEFNQTIGKEKGIFIQFRNYEGTYYENTIEVACNAGEGPELIKVNNEINKFAEIGWILPIDDMPGGKEFLATHNQDVLLPITHVVEGKTYRVPITKISYRVIYNKDLFKKAGIVDENGEAKEPKTWEDVREYAKIITEQGEGVEYGLGVPLKWDYYITNGIIPQSVAALGIDQGFNMNTGRYEWSKYKPVLKILSEIYKEGSWFPGAKWNSNDVVRVQFAEGKIGMLTAASWDVGVFTTQFTTDIDWAVVKPLVIDSNKQYKEVLQTGSLVCIGQAAEYKKEKTMEAYKFIVKAALAKAYETGMHIPYSDDIEGIVIKQPETEQLKSFANTPNSYFRKQVPTTALRLEGDDYSEVFTNILLGKIDIDRGLDDLEKRYNESLDEAIKEGLDINLYIDKDFDIKVK